MASASHVSVEHTTRTSVGRARAGAASRGRPPEGADRTVVKTLCTSSASLFEREGEKEKKRERERECAQ